MIHVFETSSFRELQHFYPAIFKSIWPRLDKLVSAGELISTKEVLRELEDQNVSETVLNWCNSDRAIFTIPTPAEQNIVATILATPRFQPMISQQAILRGKAVADPFVIAKAQVVGGTVVSAGTHRRGDPEAAGSGRHCRRGKRRELPRARCEFLECHPR